MRVPEIAGVWHVAIADCNPAAYTSAARRILRHVSANTRQLPHAAPRNSIPPHPWHGSNSSQTSRQPAAAKFKSRNAPGPRKKPCSQETPSRFIGSPRLETDISPRKLSLQNPEQHRGTLSHIQHLTARMNADLAWAWAILHWPAPWYFLRNLCMGRVRIGGGSAPPIAPFPSGSGRFAARRQH